MTSPVEAHPRTHLNNVLQMMYGTEVSKHLRWEVISTGSPNSPVWHATVYIDDMNYGTASAGTKNAAMDQAALTAYHSLKREGMSSK
ncbi:hypothetical protein M405DRAFT_803550 [Rhizopogon salebrosus TDB-379]|nr:hypothetical protein M405DRAFT_803550 [Rhizopogon salebrosus TDB-379]